MPAIVDSSLPKRTQQILAFVFGVVFIVVMVVIALVVDEPTGFQYFVFRVVLALAAAGVAAMFPGFIKADIPDWVRAGGALAVFALVLYYSPGTLVV